MLADKEGGCGCYLVSGGIPTSVLHDVEEGDHDAGDGLEKRRRVPPPVCVDHRAQSVVEDPPPHRGSGGWISDHERRRPFRFLSPRSSTSRRRRSR